MSAPGPQSGLTLPEVLIALSLLGLIGTMMAPVLYNTSRITTRVEARAGKSESMRTGQYALQRLARNAIWGDDLHASLTVKGTHNSLEFGSYDPGGAPSVTDLSIPAIGAGLTVSIRELNNEGTVLYENTLLPGIKINGLRYYGRINARAEPAWHQTWASSRLPRLVRLEGVDADAHWSYDLAFAGQAPVFCEFDPVSRLCRNAG